MTKGIPHPEQDTIETRTTSTRSSSPADSDKCNVIVYNKNDDNNNNNNNNNASSSSSSSSCARCWPTLPLWAQEQQRQQWGEKLMIHEWEGGKDGSGDPDDVDQYRQENGWKGSDLVHSVSSPVRILEYRVQYGTTAGGVGVGGAGTTLTAVVHFTERAESHKGYCHGGSMCSIMDDIIGWTGFCVTGSCRPWTGYTVQVNTSLMKPIQVGQVLKLTCVINKVERRKVFLNAKLVEPSPADSDGSGGENGNGNGNGDRDRDRNQYEEVVHATGEGLVIVNRGVLDGQ